MILYSCAYERPSTHRPRILICGAKGQGQSSHLGPAILHTLEKMPVHRLDLPALYSVSTNTPEECCAQVGLCLLVDSFYRKKEEILIHFCKKVNYGGCDVMMSVHGIDRSIKLRPIAY